MVKQSDIDSLWGKSSEGPIKIGTRGSPLALAQAQEVSRRLVEAGIVKKGSTKIQTIQTTGDKIFDKPLTEFGGKGLFTKEIDSALLAGEIEMAIHSMKDLPIEIPTGICVTCLLPREDPRDVLLGANSIMSLPDKAVVGTSSLRRSSQILNLRPDISIVNFRGNIDSRIRKLHQGAVDATLFAYAGLRRLGRDTAGGSILEVSEMLPAPAQGAIAVATRIDDKELEDHLLKIHDHRTEQAVSCERAFLSSLGGSCRTPIAALAQFQTDGKLLLNASILSIDGSKRFDVRLSGISSEAEQIGLEAGERIRVKAGTELPNWG